MCTKVTQCQFPTRGTTRADNRGFEAPQRYIQHGKIRAITNGAVGCRHIVPGFRSVSGHVGDRCKQTRHSNVGRNICAQKPTPTDVPGMIRHDTLSVSGGVSDLLMDAKQVFKQMDANQTFKQRAVFSSNIHGTAKPEYIDYALVGLKCELATQRD